MGSATELPTIEFAKPSNCHHVQLRCLPISQIDQSASFVTLVFQPMSQAERRVHISRQEGQMLALKKILFPTDFSANADRALAHAIRLANFDSGEVIVQHVVDSYFEKHPHWATLFDLHELQKFMDMYVETHMAASVPKENSWVRVRTVISKGKPAEEISALAEREMADLVVMGSARGVVTNQVIRMTNRPVLAVSSARPDSRPDDHQIKKIVVATDFSEHSKKVVQYAFDLKAAFDATVYMLYVIETNRAVEFAIRQGHFTATIDKMREWADNQLINLTPDEFIDDPKVIRRVEYGAAGDTIANVALEVGADLTILGTHEYGTIHRHLLGTTTDKLLAKAATAVLTVKL
jgi:nucleotide-binding universal stress UspA family protein